MSALKTHHKKFIIKQLACYESPSQIVDQVQEKFGVKVSLNQLSYYNPENAQGSQQLANKWIELFYETRDKFLGGAVQIPIAHKMYRLQKLQDNYEKLIKMDNIMDALKVLDQAAKEVGGAYGDIRDKVDETKKGDGSDFYQRINQKIIQVNQNNN